MIFTATVRLRLSASARNTTPLTAATDFLQQFVIAEFSGHLLLREFFSPCETRAFASDSCDLKLAKSRPNLKSRDDRASKRETSLAASTPTYYRKFCRLRISFRGVSITA